MGNEWMINPIPPTTLVFCLQFNPPSRENADKCQIPDRGNKTVHQKVRTLISASENLLSAFDFISSLSPFPILSSKINHVRIFLEAQWLGFHTFTAKGCWFNCWWWN